MTWGIERHSPGDHRGGLDLDPGDVSAGSLQDDVDFASRGGPEVIQGDARFGPACLLEELANWILGDLVSRLPRLLDQAGSGRNRNVCSSSAR